MGFFELILIAIGLSMDAFAVALGKGLCTKKVLPRHYLTVGLWFGIFQGLMPAIGYLLASSFEEYITSFDHWIAFGLLALIGANMIKEGLEKEDEKAVCEVNSFGVKSMFVLAIATSIDALAAGISLCAAGVSSSLTVQPNLLTAVLLIFAVTFLLSMVGVKIGNIFGMKYKSRAEIAGGIILILMGTKILLEHLGVINL